jgi:thioredoxin-like negative regulator of GroEL
MTPGGRGWRRISWVLQAAVVGGLIWGGWAWWDLRSYRGALARIRGEIHAGRPGHAAQHLRDLLAWKPGSDEAAYLLGTCEQARGRPQDAAAAWRQVPPDSPFAAQAIQGLMELEVQRGRLADAEKLVRDALDDPRIRGSGLTLALGVVYAQQGRVEEAGRLIEESWERLERAGEASLERAIPLVRLHIRLRRDPPPVEAIRAFLDRAARRAPDDDRVWLGKAILAIRTGSYAEAARWLDACQRRRPEDVPVWRARLDWARATNQLEAVRQAAEHLPGAGSSPALVPNLAAWLAARRGDVEAERRALERLLAADPTEFAAWDRLAELAVQAGQPECAAGLRRGKAEIQRLQTRYQELDRRNQPIRDAAELARLAAVRPNLAPDLTATSARLERGNDRIERIRQLLSEIG